MKRALTLVLFGVLLSAASLAAEDQSAPAELSPIWRWANFLILGAVLVYLMARFLPPIFASRIKEIQKGISESQQMKLDAERRSAEMDARLNSLGAEIERFKAASAAEMQQEGERISRETVAQIKKIEQQAAVELESVGKTARRQLKEYAGELALRLAEERLRARIDGAAESALVEGFVRDLEHQASQKNGSQNKGTQN